MEVAKKIETSGHLRPWLWYAGALQQHHFATLMAIEVFGSPQLDYAKRAWKSLDWVFQVPCDVPHAHKGRWVLEGAVEVMKKYLKARKLRCPTLMDERLVIVASSPRTPTLSQAPTKSKTRASREDMGTTSGAQATFVHETTCGNIKQVCTDWISPKMLGHFLGPGILTVEPGVDGWKPTGFHIPCYKKGTRFQRGSFLYI